LCPSPNSLASSAGLGNRPRDEYLLGLENFTVSLNAYLWIAVGSALGGVTRVWASVWLARRLGETFPWGTLFVNVTGSFLIGLFFASTASVDRAIIGPTLRQFFMLGLCGGYTTFSSFSLETLSLFRAGEIARAGCNIGLSVALCLFAVWAGFALGSARAGGGA
jgi:CrcB protein